MFLLENAVFRTEQDSIELDRVKIVACDGKSAQQSKQKQTKKKKSKK